MKKIKVYISSAMTGRPGFNYLAFNEKAEELRNLGFDVINPTKIGEEYGFGRPHSFYMRKALEMLLGADILLVFGNIAGSRGVEFEVTVAKMLDIPIWREVAND